jgi:putative membrane protein
MNIPATFRSRGVLALKGMLMGAADVVPGVSGGTIAFITGIYDTLLAAISSFDLRWFRLVFTGRIREAYDAIPWGFLLPLVAGIALSIFSLARGVSFLLTNHPQELWSFFFGLVLASTWIVASGITPRRLPFWLFLSAGAIGSYLLVGLIPVATPSAFWFTFLSGSVAATAMILPGISGSFILVLLSQYQRLLEAVKNLDLNVLIWFVAGAFLGLISFSRFLKWLLSRYSLPTLAVLCGFMLGSLRKVWPYQEVLESAQFHDKVVVLKTRNVLPVDAGSEVVLHFLLMVAGFLLVVGISVLARRAQKKEELDHD